MSYITIKRNGKKQAVNLDRKKRSYMPTKVLKSADLKKIHIHDLHQVTAVYLCFP